MQAYQPKNQSHRVTASAVVVRSAKVIPKGKIRSAGTGAVHRSLAVKKMMEKLDA